MSKKSSRRRSKGTSSAAVNAQLAALTDCVDGFGSSTDLSGVVSCTSRILSLATAQGSERRALMHKSSNGMSVLLKTLKVSDDPAVVMNIMSTLNVLANHRYVVLMVKEGAVSAVMNSLVDTSRSQWSSLELFISHLTLLNKFSSRDKKFGVKARLCGTLPIIIRLLKTTQDDQDNLIIILVLLKSLTINSVNSEYLGKLGCLSIIIKQISKVAQRNLCIVKHCINVLALLLKSRVNASRSAAQDCVRQLLLLHKQLHHTDISSRHILLRKKVLQCLKLCITTDANLQTFHKNSGLQVLYVTAKQNSEGVKTDTRAIASLTCMILRRGLPPVSLPLSSLDSVVSFPLPENPGQDQMLKKEMSSLSESSSAKTTSSDLSSQLGPKESPWEGQSEVEEGVHTSMASTMMVPFFTMRLQEDLSRDFLVRDSDSDNNNNACSDCSNAGDLHASIHILGTTCSCSSSRPNSNGRSLVSANGEVDDKIRSDLEQFVKYFPELDETKNYWFPSQSLAYSYSYSNSSSDPNKWADLKGISSYDPDGIQEMVVVPTATECSGSSTEDLSDPKDSPIPVSLKQSAVKSVIHFAEDPLPQVLGPHQPPPPAEPVYLKRNSVDRKLYLSDVARITRSKAVINKVVFDLDSLLCPTEEKNPLLLPEPDNPVTVTDEVDIVTPSLQDLAVLEALDSDDGQAPLCFEQVPLSDACDTINPASESTNSSSTTDRNPSHLEFESRFESGNLRKAILVRRYEYDLLLNADINTNHHHQWFYFKVSNIEAGVPYRFNIINCEKPNSQFNYGMQPVMYSATEADLRQQGWVRTGTNISYYKNNFTVFGDSTEQGSTKKKRKTYYTLTFTIVFQHEKDICYFAYHYPYTYSMLQTDLEALEDKLKSRDLYYHRQPLCTTLCGNICPLITISSEQSDRLSPQVAEGEKESKRYIVLSARVHPGESNSSWVMRGLLQHLISDHPDAKALRDKFVFKIIPMLNPDGVIHGSHRCSLCGEDLNRQWIAPDPSLHPTIYSTKSLLQWLVATNRRPEVYCDFHGHSRKKNIFMYGCKDSSSSNTEQVLPQLMDKIAPFFSFNNCSFLVEKCKEATARVVVWKELGVTKSYTMESTYCGADQGQHKGRQIGTQDLEEIGVLLCEGLLHMDEQPDSDPGGYSRPSGTRSGATLSFRSDSSSYKSMSGDDSASS